MCKSQQKINNKPQRHPILLCLDAEHKISVFTMREGTKMKTETIGRKKIRYWICTLSSTRGFDSICRKLRNNSIYTAKDSKGSGLRIIENKIT